MVDIIALCITIFVVIYANIGGRNGIRYFVSVNYGVHNTVDSVEYPGWKVTCHPMPKEETLPHKFFRDIEEAYKAGGKEVLHVLAYSKREHDPVICTMWQLNNNPVVEYGAEVIWRWPEEEENG